MEISNAAADQLAEVIASYVNDSGDDRVQLIGEVLGEDSSGTTWVHILGGEQRTPVTSTNAKVHKGDIVYVVIGDGRADILGNVSRPSTDDTLAEVVQQRVVETERVVERIEATAITADSAEIQQLNADHAVIETLDSTYASIDNLNAATARIGSIEADYLVAADMTAEQARVGQLIAGKADVADLTAANARIDTLESTKADISMLESDYITAEAIDATYLHADMSNADVAWIQNGVIKDAAISDAQIIGVSANKLTAGTIDASNINVTNLRADNLKVTRINGQPVIGGYALVDPSTSGYSSKNPKAQGWYELSGSSYLATNDTSVVSGKNYYSTSDYAELYDQDAIDGMVDSLNNRIDAQIETWTTDAVPTLNNYPASSWTTSDAKAEHVGDICYVMNAGNDYDGYTYRFAYDNSTSSYKWVLIKDNQVTAALGRISDLETFESETSTWIDETDEGLRTIRSNHTALAGRVDKVVKSSVQLWYTKANETAPNAPSSAVTSTSTSGNGWRTVVPTYNSSYPFYFYCWQYQYEDGTYDWSAVVYDRATSESEERARTGVTNAASAQTTANANIKSSVQLWFTKANDTAPSKPSGTNPITVSDASKRNQWNLVVPTYSDSYPYYFYCYQQQKGDNTYQWTDVVYDEATSTAMKKAQEALPSSTFATFEQTTFKEVVDDVDEQSTKITTLTTITENNGLTETTNISNTVNQVSQTASGNSAKLSNITETIGANADGTNPSTKSVIARTSAVEQTLEGFQTTVTNVQRTAEEANDRGVAYSGTSSTGASTADKVAACTNFELVAGATVTVRFSAANTSTGAITLNVNNTGKRTVYVNGAATSSSNQLLWGANANVTFTYDGSYWRIVSEPRPWVGSCSVAAGTAAKTATINEVVICKGTSVTLNMTYSNTSASATLNVTSTGAKNIYYGTTSTRPTTENGYGWTDASTQTFVFDGAYWRIGDTSALAGLAAANGILSSHTTQIAQNAQDIEMKANSNEVYTKTQTDGLITSEVEARNAAIKVSADSITQRVSEEYATKTALDTTNEKIDNLEIGGRNLAKASDAVATPTTYNALNIYLSEPFEAEQTYVFQLWDVDVSHSAKSTVRLGVDVYYCGGSIKMSGWHGATYFTNGHADHLQLTLTPHESANTDATGGSETTSNSISGASSTTKKYIRLYNSVPSASGTMNLTVGKWKLEKGNRATDWSPAPEDLDAHFEAVESSITQTADSITESVSKTYSTKDEAQIDRSGSGTSVEIDGAANAALKSLHIIGESVQDGTPTPSAPVEIRSVGAVNLLDEANFLKAYFGNSITANSNHWTFWLPCNPNTTYTVSKTMRENGVDRFVIGYTATVPAAGVEVSSILRIQTTESMTYAGQRVIRTYTTGSNAKYIVIWAAYGTFDSDDSEYAKLQVSVGSHEVQYVPHGNLGLMTRGKNLLWRTMTGGTVNGVTFTVNADGSVSTSGTATGNATQEITNIWLQAGTYTLSGSPSGGSYSSYLMDMNGSPVGADIGNGFTFTLAEDTVLPSLRIRIAAGTVTDGLTFRPQLELGSEATEYEPYSGTVTPIPLNGHELRSLPDGTRDELTVDVDGHVTMTQRVMVHDLGTWNFSRHSSYGYFYHTITDKALGWNNLLCSAYSLSSAAAASMPDKHFRGSTSQGAVFYMDSDYSDATSFKAAMNGVEIHYALATPKTIDLGTIDMPQVKDGDTVEVIAALTPSIDVTWWASAGQAVADAYASLSSAIEVRAESIVSTVSERYATSDAVDAIATQITQTATSWTAAFNQLRYGDDEEPTDDNKKLKMTLAQAFEALGVTSENLDELRSYVRIATDAQNKPYLLMGSEKSPIMMALTNDSLKFMHGSDPVAYIDVDGETNEGELHITRATIDNELRFGNKELGSIWRWHVRANGNLALGWTSGAGDE